MWPNATYSDTGYGEEAKGRPWSRAWWHPIATVAWQDGQFGRRPCEWEAVLEEGTPERLAGWLGACRAISSQPAGGMSVENKPRRP